MNMHAAPFWNYWGKARPENDGPQFHRLVYHSLDVAAVGTVYLEQAGTFVDACCRRLNCNRAAFISWASFFLAMHDLGKFSDTFQSLRSDLVQALQGRAGRGDSYTVRHDTLGYWAWKDLCDEGFLEEQGIAGGRRGIHCWARAVCGHHGMPPVDFGDANRHFRPMDCDAAASFAAAMAQLFLSGEARAIPAGAGAAFEEESGALSWWMAGLTVLADWLGSDTAFFAYQTEVRDLDTYWQEALQSARKALQVSGVRPVSIAPGKQLTDFFSYIEQPSPLQAWAQSVELESGPQIVLLEDVTGAGKTEAAMMLAYRLMAQGAAQGFFIGLPTMATANAMYERVAGVYQQLFAEDASLALGHGFRDLVDCFATSVLPEGRAEDDPAQRDETASARCTAWLADHNKRVLLAPAGVGTVDQALLAVLHSKHQSLRLLGLFNKVLIVDEVHACDTYMEGVLQVLLAFHASMGGSAILLSATLPERMKTALLGAYARGRGLAPPAQRFDPAYPLATHWNLGSPILTQQALASRANVSRSVQIRYMSDECRLHDELCAALAQGKCVGWIRNTVADAVSAYESLAPRVGSENIIMFHARFALHDRLQTERAVLACFGNDSSPAERKGRLMIATQVAEQSLDVDFDVLVSDLAPIDRLLQRAGRAQRHVRDACGNRIRHSGAADGRPAPALWVLAPEWTESPAPDWYGATFGTAQYVYDRHDQLWLTAKTLQEGRIAMPGDARRLIEAVYSGSDEVPATLLPGALRAEGARWAHASQAQMNTLSLNGGYRRGEIGDWWADAKTPSRLGEEMIEVMLARWVAGRLERWHEGRWPYSMVKVAARSIARAELGSDAVLIQAYNDLKLTLPARGEYCVLLPLRQRADGGWHGQAWTADSDARPAQLRTWLYDTRLGLRIEESDAADAASD